MWRFLPIFSLTLISICPAQDPGAKDSRSWDKGPLVTLLDGTIAPLSPDKLRNLPIGYPAFNKLTFKKSADKKRWDISGIIVSTNTGFPLPDSAVYFRSGEKWKLGTCSNSKGEVLFTIPTSQTDSYYLYVTSNPSGNNIPSDNSILREYKLDPSKAEQDAAANP